MQTTAAAAGDVTMATLTPAEVSSTKPQSAMMSARASAFSIASLMADCADSSGSSSVSSSSAATDSDCVSASGTCRGRRQRRYSESPSASPQQDCSSCSDVGMYTVAQYILGNDIAYTNCVRLPKLGFNRHGWVGLGRWCHPVRQLMASPYFFPQKSWRPLLVIVLWKVMSHRVKGIVGQVHRVLGI